MRTVLTSLLVLQLSEDFARNVSMTAGLDTLRV